MNISSASTLDYIQINANMHMLYNDRYDCDNKYLDRPEKKRKEILRKNGCLGAVDHVIAIVDNIIFRRCLCAFKFPRMGWLLSVLRHYENGVMPFSGSLLEQPAQIIELLEIALTAKNREIEKLRDKHGKE